MPKFILVQPYLIGIVGDEFVNRNAINQFWLWPPNPFLPAVDKDDHRILLTLTFRRSLSAGANELMSQWEEAGWLHDGGPHD